MVSAMQAELRSLIAHLLFLPECKMTFFFTPSRITELPGFARFALGAHCSLFQKVFAFMLHIHDVI